MNERLEQIIKHPAVIPAVVGVLSFGGGLAVGFFIGRRPRPVELTKEEQAELDDIRAGVQKLKDQPPSKIVVDEEYLAKRDAEVKAAGIVEEAEVVVVEVVGSEEDPEPVTIEQKTVRRSIFAQQVNPDDDWDYEEEVKHRTPHRPYVIHRDEFFSDDDDLNHHPHQLTYYNGDNVLVDEERKPIHNLVEVLGELKFGHGSDDPNVVYIRNEKLKADYEVCLDEGLYSVDVEGADMEDVLAKNIQHSAVRKMRPE